MSVSAEDERDEISEDAKGARGEASATGHISGRTIDGVLFDNDGTLSDTYQMILQSFRHATHEVLGHVPPDEKLMAKVGIPLVDQMKDFSDDPAVQQRLLEVYRTYEHQIHDQLIGAFPGEHEALERLAKAGMPMGVVTSKRHATASHGLEVLGVRQYFTAFVGCDDCDRHKPDPAPVVLGAQMLGLDPARCAYVGDSPFDMRAGLGAGCVTIGIEWGMFDDETLLAEHPDALCASFGELADVLLSLKA
jgi:pyrophosphatase PpaX